MKTKLLASDILLISKALVAEDTYLQLPQLSPNIDYNQELKESSGPFVQVLAPNSSDTPKSDAEAIIDFGNRTSVPGFQSKSFYFINNPDQSIRWIFPTNLPKPTFLNLYNSAGFKAKLFTSFTRLFYKTPLFNLLISGSFTIHYKTNLRIEKEITSVEFDNYSIFTGTPGPNRKLLIELNSQDRTHHFVKLAITPISAQLILNETRNLNSFSNHTFEHICLPETAASSSPTVAILSNIKPPRAQQPTDLTSTHLYALKELYDQTTRIERLDHTEFHENIINNLSLLRSASRFDKSEMMFRALQDLSHSLNVQYPVAVSRTHSDFTPWNMYVHKHQLYLYDWELSSCPKPLLFDLFHFVFQSQVLLKKKSYASIKNKLEKLKKDPIIQLLIKKYDIDFDLNLRLYLLINVSYYLNVYETQPYLHTQANWLVDVWSEALNDQAFYHPSLSHRSVFVEEFTQRLQNTHYAFLKFHEQSLDQIHEDSDLDILILKQDLPAIRTYTTEHRLISKCSFYSKSFMTTIELFFKDGSFLSLDLIHQFQRKSLNMMDARKVLISAIKNEAGISVPSPNYDFEYTFLFYQLNGASIPEKYQRHFLSMDYRCQTRIKNYINKEFGLRVFCLEELFNYSSQIQTQVFHVLSHKPINSHLIGFIKKWNYLKDTIQDLRKRKGFVVTFSGVDGAGKSTMIEHTVKRLSSQYRRRLVVLRHRPSILPILSVFRYGKKAALDKAANQLPHQGTNRSKLSSFFRFSYYYTDYLLGQFYIFFKYILRGYIVIYDRYYFDFINDPERSNIHISSRFARLLYRLILKPRLNIFLYASPEIIRSRKQELDPQKIKEITQKYQRLFTSFEKRYQHSHYIPIENIDAQATINQIIREYHRAA